jgi:hypothetical protein
LEYDLFKGPNHGRKRTGGKSKATLRIQKRVKKNENHETIEDPQKNGRRNEEMLACGSVEEETVGASAEEHES